MSPTFYQEAYAPREIVAGDYPLVTKSVTIAAGQVLSRGAVLGRITATGKCVLSVAAATDGSQVPYAILANESIDASAADTVGASYISGQFLGKNLTLGAGHTVAGIADVLRDANIYIQ